MRNFYVNILVVCPRASGWCRGRMAFIVRRTGLDPYRRIRMTSPLGKCGAPNCLVSKASVARGINR